MDERDDVPEAKGAFEQYSLVRVTRLLRPWEEYDGWKVNKRGPQIGDIGAIVEILRAPGLRDVFVFENVGADGGTTWLADFWAEELELVVQVDS